MPLWIDHKSPNHQVMAGIPRGRGEREKTTSGGMRKVWGKSRARGRKIREEAEAESHAKNVPRYRHFRQRALAIALDLPYELGSKREAKAQHLSLK